MFPRHPHITVIACVSVLACGLSGCGNGGLNLDASHSTKMVVNGVTIDFKETETDKVRQRFQTDKTPQVQIDLFNGKITVDAAETSAVEAEVTRTGAGETKEQAKENLQLIDVQMRQGGNVVRITARRNIPEAATTDPATIKKQFGARSADAVVHVPAGAVLELKTASGDVRVQNIAGRVEVDTSSGTISVNDGTGEVKAHSAYGSVTVDGKNTAVKADSRSGSVTVSGTRGPVEASSGYGTVKVEGAAEKVTARSDSGDVQVKDCKGAVQLRSGYGILSVDGAADVDADTRSGAVFVRRATGAVKAKSHYGKLFIEQAPAGATLETTSGDIRLKGGQGPVQLTSGYGQLDADVDGAVVRAVTKNGNVRVRGRLNPGESVAGTNYGDVTLVLPFDSTFRVDASTKYGHCKSDFPVNQAGRTDSLHLQGTVGDAPKAVLKLHTNSGNIEIHKE